MPPKARGTNDETVTTTTRRPRASRARGAQDSEEEQEQEQPPLVLKKQPLDPQNTRIERKTDVKTEQVNNPQGKYLTRRTTTTTVTTITVEENENEEAPKIFPNKESTPLYRRASLYRSFVLADWITMMNAVMGVSCILFCLNYLTNNNEDMYLIYAFGCLPLALIFDIFDGSVARYQQKQSPWGSDLDSLSDCISFTLCPAALAFTIGFRSFWDCLALCWFTFCGVSRLARYNVTSQHVQPGQKVKYYEGFPVPTSLVLDVIMFAMYWYGYIGDNIPFGTVTLLGKQFHFLSIIFIAWGCMFVSASIRIPKP